MVVWSNFNLNGTQTVLLHVVSSQLVARRENQATACAFVDKYLLPSLTNIIIHVSVQMVVVSEQMCDTVILKGALRLIQ